MSGEERGPNVVDVTDLTEPGSVRLIENGEFSDSFVVRVQADVPIPGSVPAEGDHQFAAFGRSCTHAGAHLVAARHSRIESVAAEGVIRCPAHLTCFDLRRGGLVVIGQATARLPQVELAPVDAGHVRLVRWLGLPFGRVRT